MTLRVCMQIVGILCATSVSVSVRHAREMPRLFAAKPLRAGGHIGWGFSPQLTSEIKQAALKGRRKKEPCPFRAQVLYCLTPGAESPRLYPLAATRPAISLHAIRIGNIHRLSSTVGQHSPRSGVIPVTYRCPLRRNCLQRKPHGVTIMVEKFASLSWPVEGGR